MQEWISGCSHDGRKERDVLRLDEGSEHQVFFDPVNGRVIKLTRRGIFGESYYLVNNIIHQKNCSPLEYLLRLRTWKKLFVSAPEALGITEHGQIVSIQNFISGEEPTQQEVDEFLTASLFMPAKQNFWLWKRPSELFDIWLGDARKDNFVKTAAGIVPIDIRLWF